MNSRDRDLLKLKKHIKSLGLKLYYRKYTKNTGSAEYLSGEFITLFKKKTTKKDIIMCLLHELGHHYDWLTNPVMDPLTTAALFYLSNGPMQGKRQDIPKKYRKAIYKTECNGVRHMTAIHKELQLEIPYNLVVLQQSYDLYDYETLYKEGKFPTKKEYRKFVNEKRKN